MNKRSKMQIWSLVAVAALAYYAEAKSMEFVLSAEKHTPLPGKLDKFLQHVIFKFLAPTNGSKLGPMMDVFGYQVHSAIYSMRYYVDISFGTPPQTFSGKF
jgi:hypothetical protein